MARYFITSKEDVAVEKLLSQNLPEGSDPLKILAAGGVWLNSKTRITDRNFIIKKGITFRVYTSPGQGKEYELKPEDVVFENRDLMVVYKPPGLNVHEVPATRYFNLTHGVNRYLADISIKYESVPVTRLDRVVEGLVIFPKSKSSEKALFRLIMDRKIHKWYSAVLESEKGDRQKRIVNYIYSDGSKTHEDRKKGKISDSLFVRTGEKIYSVFIFTGRRHQIRCHASDYVGPIAGDTRYGASSSPGRGIGLVCRGYNIPWKGRNLRIRLSSEMLSDFFRRNSLPAS